MRSELAKQAGFTITLVQEASNDAKLAASLGTDETPSAFDYCAHDVALGYIDVCLPTLWETDARRKFVEFLPPTQNDDFKLVGKSLSTRSPYSGTITGILQNPLSFCTAAFSPFSHVVWILIILFI